MAKSLKIFLFVLVSFYGLGVSSQSPTGKVHDSPRTQEKLVLGSPETPFVVQALPPVKTQADQLRMEIKSSRETYLFWGNCATIICTITLVISNLWLIKIYKTQVRIMSEGLMENAKAAEASASAALATNEMANLMLKIEQPLIAIERMGYENRSHRCEILFGNHGRTPAMFKEFNIDYVCEKFISDQAVYNSAQSHKVLDQGVANMGGVFQAHAVLGISEGDWERILKGEFKVWFFGYIEYEDFMHGLIRYCFCRVFAPTQSQMYPGSTPSEGEWHDDGPSAYRGTVQIS